MISREQMKVAILESSKILRDPNMDNRGLFEVVDVSNIAEIVELDAVLGLYVNGLPVDKDGFLDRLTTDVNSTYVIDYGKLTKLIYMWENGVCLGLRILTTTSDDGKNAFSMTNRTYVATLELLHVEPTLDNQKKYRHIFTELVQEITNVILY